LCRLRYAVEQRLPFAALDAPASAVPAKDSSEHATRVAVDDSGSAASNVDEQAAFDSASLKRVPTVTQK